MKFSKKTKEYAALVILGVLLFWALNNYQIFLKILSYASGILQPFILGAIIAFILNVPMSGIEKHFFKDPKNPKTKKIIDKIKRPCSIILTLLFCAGVIVFVCWLVIPALIDTFTKLSSDVPVLFKNIGDKLQESKLVADWMHKINFDQGMIIDKFTSWLKNSVLVLQTLDSTIGFASRFFSSIVNFFLGICFAVYMLAQKEKLKSQSKRIFTAFLPQKLTSHCFKIARRSVDTFGKFLVGQCTEAVLLGGLCAIGMTIFQFPYAAIVAVLVGCTALIPIVGAFLGYVVGFLLICSVNFKQAVFFIIFMIILQAVEGNFIYPRVVGNSVGLPGLWVLFAVTIGGNMFGIFGMFLSVPVCSVIYCTLSELVEFRNHKKEAEEKSKLEKQQLLSNK
ncbi:MAG: AI-2E family transporter [Hominimerdicola sp.]